MHDWERPSTKDDLVFRIFQSVKRLSCIIAWQLHACLSSKSCPTTVVWFWSKFHINQRTINNGQWHESLRYSRNISYFINQFQGLSCLGVSASASASVISTLSSSSAYASAQATAGSFGTANQASIASASATASVAASLTGQPPQFAPLTLAWNWPLLFISCAHWCILIAEGIAGRTDPAVWFLVMQSIVG